MYMYTTYRYVLLTCTYMHAAYMYMYMCTHLQSFLHFLFGFGVLVFEDVVSGVQVHQNLTRRTLGTSECVCVSVCVCVSERVCECECVCVCCMFACVSV